MAFLKDGSKGSRRSARTPGARLGALLLPLLIVAAATGCLVTRNHDGSATIWTPVATHVHSEHCGHYADHDTWYEIKGHRHGHDCGHHQVSGRWIIRR